MALFEKRSGKNADEWAGRAGGLCKNTDQQRAEEHRGKWRGERRVGAGCSDCRARDKQEGRGKVL